MVVGYNHAVWPAHIVAVALALALLGLALRNRAGGERRCGGHVSGLALAAAWAWTGAVFHLQHFAAINFMAPMYGWVFMGQALLFA